ALGGEGLLHAASFRSRPLASARRLRLQLGAHLAREARDWTETEEMRRIALIRADGALAVAPQEGILRLRAGAVGPALRVAAEASEGIGPPCRPLVDATQARRVVDRVPVRPPAPPTVLGAEQVSEELIAHDEEGIDGQDARIQGVLRERGVLDQPA